MRKPRLTQAEIDQMENEILQQVDEACNEAATLYGPDAAVELLARLTKHVSDWMEKNEK
jgi:hypothetical protein